MLKEYFDSDSCISKPITVVDTVPQESNVFEPEVNSNFIDKCDPGPSKLENSDILRNLNNKLSHLETSQQEELKQLIHEYEHLFPDIPTRTDKIYHDVIVEDSKTIKQHPYRMNPLKQKYLHDEVKYLLENDFIEPSQGNYSSPCILVPKSNGTYRMCTDYRKVNSRVRAVDRHCRKMRQKNKFGARFFHLAKVCGDNFLSSNLNSTY